MLVKGWTEAGKKEASHLSAIKLENSSHYIAGKSLRILLLQVGMSRDSLGSLCSWHKIMEVSNQQTVNDDAESYLCHEDTQGVCEDPQQL